MGDMGDLFNDLKDIRRTRAQERVEAFNAKRPELEDAIKEVIQFKRYTAHFVMDPSGTFNVKLYDSRKMFSSKPSATIQFYPTKGTWQVRGKMWHGGVDAFATWVQRTLRALI